MTLLTVVMSLTLAQAPASPAPPASPVCGEASEDAADALRRAASSRRDPAARKRALEQLECMYDEKHLNRPREADPVLRELIAMSPGDLAPLFRLAKLQEKQELFDAAESTLLAARQQKPDDVAVYRELSQYFARRAAALAASKEKDERAGRVEEPGRPDKDGDYPLGGR